MKFSLINHDKKFDRSGIILLILVFAPYNLTILLKVLLILACLSRISVHILTLSCQESYQDGSCLRSLLARCLRSHFFGQPKNRAHRLHTELFGGVEILY